MAELPQTQIIYLIGIGTIGMLSLTGGIAAFIAIYQKRMLQEQEKQRAMEAEYQQKMIQAQIESQETERKRMAADLHDSIGSILWATKLNVAFLGRSVPLAGELKESYDETMKMLDQSIDSIKRISWELTPEAFQHSGLLSSIEELCSRLNGKGQQLSLEVHGDPIFWRDNRALMTFRIVQELVNNAVKHSKANTIKINMSWALDRLRISVDDNGIGFTLKPDDRKGVGWWNIMNRASKINSTIQLKEGLEVGSSVELTIPLT